MADCLKRAIEYYAQTYVGMVVGTEIEEGRSAGEQVAHEFKYRYEGQGMGVYPDWCVADYVRSEANALEM